MQPVSEARFSLSLGLTHFPFTLYMLVQLNYPQSFQTVFTLNLISVLTFFFLEFVPYTDLVSPLTSLHFNKYVLSVLAKPYVYCAL